MPPVSLKGLIVPLYSFFVTHGLISASERYRKTYYSRKCCVFSTYITLLTLCYQWLLEKPSSSKQKCNKMLLNSKLFIHKAYGIWRIPFSTCFNTICNSASRKKHHTNYDPMRIFMRYYKLNPLLPCVSNNRGSICFPYIYVRGKGMFPYYLIKAIFHIHYSPTRG